MKKTKLRFYILSVLISFSIIACGPDKFISRNNLFINPRDSGDPDGVNIEPHIKCKPNSEICRKGHFYMCVQVSGNCRCEDETRTSFEWGSCPTYDGETGRMEQEPCVREKEETVRECQVEAAAFIPSNIEAILGDEIPQSAMKDALKCTVKWEDKRNSYSDDVGFLWVYLKSKDNQCFETKPN